MEKKAITAVYSAAHFLVDLSCAFLILRYAYNGQSENILLYNFCAFALQMPIGILLDRFGGGHRMASLGCGLILISYFTAFGSLFTPAAVLSGVGNALFHAGGGVYVLDKFEDSTALGIFVSPGAIGLYLGTLWANGGEVSCVFPLLAMAVSAAVIFAAPYIFKSDSKSGEPASEFFTAKTDSRAVFAAILFFTVVIIRSFGGFALQLEWKTTASAAFAAVLAAAMGKALGGFASDCLGKKSAAAVSLCGAALLYLLSDKMVFGLAAVLLFNMSMPMTLRGAADIFRGGRGFSFGLLTFALFLGFLPVYLWDSQAQISRGIMCILCIASAAMLLTGFLIMGRKKNSDG